MIRSYHRPRLASTMKWILVEHFSEQGNNLFVRSFVRSFLSVYNCSNKIYPLCLFPIDFYICTECAIRENKTAYLYMFGFYNVHILPSTLFILAKQCA